MRVDLGLPPVRQPTPAGRPEHPELVDRFARQARDLRVSVTDRCTLRCGYCMPAEGLAWMPESALLTDDELIRLIRLAVRELGITKVRFTGGEPLLRRSLETVVAATAELTTQIGRPVGTAVTTNGLSLAHRAQSLAAAGLGRVNVSLDTLDPDRFESITRRRRLDDVLAGIAAAHQAGLTPVKVNAVLVRGVNDDEAVDLLDWALANGHELRFIEAMPLDAQGQWRRDQVVPADETLAALSRRYRLAALPGRGAAPAQTYEVRDAAGRLRGRVGVIASVTRPFCADCDRTRLTADGQVRNCLFARAETDLRALLRDGADDDQLADAWRGDAWAKAAGHGIDEAGFVPPERPMSAIGG